MEVHESAKNERQDASRNLRSDYGPSLGPDVRDEPAEETQDKHRQELHHAQQADVDDGLVPPDQRAEEPAQGQRRHPRPSHRDQLAEEEEPEVAVVEGAAGGREPNPSANDHCATSRSSATRSCAPTCERCSVRTSDAIAPAGFTSWRTRFLTVRSVKARRSSRRLGPDGHGSRPPWPGVDPVSYTHLRAHETVLDLVCRLLLEKKKKKKKNT